MTDQLTTVATRPATKVRWFRRRPPEDLTGFLRRMWWVGHAQLFISAGAAAIGVVSTVVTVTMIAGRLEPSFYWTLTFGAWMLAYALPFLTSGIALRAAAVALAEIDRPSGRIILGIVYVITIAVVSVIFVFACTLAQIWVLWPITTWIQSSIEPSMY